MIKTLLTIPKKSFEFHAYVRKPTQCSGGILQSSHQSRAEKFKLALLFAPQIPTEGRLKVISRQPFFSSLDFEQSARGYFEVCNNYCSFPSISIFISPPIYFRMLLFPPTVYLALAKDLKEGKEGKECRFERWRV